jgi:hypothetical protein
MSIAHAAGGAAPAAFYGKMGDISGRHFQPSALQEPFIRGMGGATMGLAAPFAGGLFYPPTTAIGAALQGTALTGKQVTMEAVRKQIEYYFSVQNLCKDIFLRSKVGLLFKGVSEMITKNCDMVGIQLLKKGKLSS